MTFKNLLTIGALVVGSYWTGKISGAQDGAEAVLNKYAGNIPDDTFTVKLVDKAMYKLTVIAKKKGS